VSAADERDPALVVEADGLGGALDAVFGLTTGLGSLARVWMYGLAFSD
jgi:hypothetical protein